MSYKKIRRNLPYTGSFILYIELNILIILLEFLISKKHQLFVVLWNTIIKLYRLFKVL